MTRTTPIRATILAAALAAMAVPAQATGALAHYERMSRAERIAIEYDLIWTGGVDMVTNGVVGRESIAAIRAFERAIGGHADGILDAWERRALRKAARRARRAAGYEHAVDRATGMRIGLPHAYLGAPVPTRHGAAYEGRSVTLKTFAIPARAGIRAIFERQLHRHGRQVTYKVLRRDWFVVAGREGGRRFYTRASMRHGELRAFTISYDAHLKDRIEPVVVAMSNDFEPFAGRGRHAPRHEPRYEPPRYDAPRAEAPHGACPGRIRVEAGDTLSAIARRCGVSVRALQRLNGIWEPRDLLAGQVLAIPGPGALPPVADAEPRRGGRAPIVEPDYGQRQEGLPLPPVPQEDYAPAVSVRPRALRQGGSVTVSLTDFPPLTEVEIGFGASAGSFLSERVGLTDAGGAFEARVTVPAWLRAGAEATVVAMSGDGAHVASAGPFILRAPASAPSVERPAPLTLSGIVTGEGAACPSMRTARGDLWMLDSARSLPTGTAVEVEGYPARPGAEGRCGGRTIEVTGIARL